MLTTTAVIVVCPGHEIGHRDAQSGLVPITVCRPYKPSPMRRLKRVGEPLLPCRWVTCVALLLIIFAELGGVRLTNVAHDTCHYYFCITAVGTGYPIRQHVLFSILQYLRAMPR